MHAPSYAFRLFLILIEIMTKLINIKKLLFIKYIINLTMQKAWKSKAA